MTRTQKRLISWILAEMFFIAGIILGALYDFDLTAVLSGVSGSSATVSTGALPIVFTVLGEWPALILAAFSLQVIVVNLAKKKNNPRVLLGCVFGDIVAFLCIYAGWLLSFATVIDLTWVPAVIGVLLAVLLTLCVRLFVNHLGKQTRKSFFFPAAVTVAVELIAFVVVLIMKLVWGRYEVYQIVSDSSLSFCDWYFVHPFSGGMGFPSIQVFGSVFLLLIPMWLGNRMSTKARTIFRICVSAWLLLLSMMLMCSGRAYLSDIAFGFVIAYACVEFAILKYEKSYLGRPSPRLIQTVTTTDITAAPTAPASVTVIPVQMNNDIGNTAEIKRDTRQDTKPISSYAILTDAEKRIIAKAWARVIEEEQKKKQE